MNEVIQTIAARRSCRQFLDKQIPDEHLGLILESGLQAPSGHNDQSWYFVVLQKPELIDELSEGSKREMQKMPIDWMANAGRNPSFHVYYKAPTVLVVCSRKDAIAPIPDVSAAIENMMLAAQSLGIASCWIGFCHFFFNSTERYEKLGIPDEYEVRYGLSLGYPPEERAPQAPARKFEKYYHIIR